MKNIGMYDLIIRILLAIVIAIMYFANFITGTLAIVLLVVATVLVLTSFIKFCPLYYLLGISSKKSSK